MVLCYIWNACNFLTGIRHNNHLHNKGTFMAHDEKVRFLFEQTIKVIMNYRGVGARMSLIESDFEKHYKALEKLLDEKLSEK